MKEVYITVRLKGDFYTVDTYCKTLKEYMQKRKVKRSEIAEWWKE